MKFEAVELEVLVFDADIVTASPNPRIDPITGEVILPEDEFED